MTGNDEKYMRRALELAALAGGRCRPNPMVGAVIVHDNRIIGEGYHKRAGQPHAEPVAIESVKNRNLIPESTIYVSLEPCSHYGRTPPCATRIITEGFRRVVIGTTDTSSKVSGKGIRLIEEGGSIVETGVLEQECRFINRRFFTSHEKKRPWIVLKWAESKDGYIDRDKNRKIGTGPGWITGGEEKLVVHKWRSEEHSVLVGAGTIRADNPELTVRLWEGTDPLRITVTAEGNIPGNSKILQSPPRTIIFSGKDIKVKEGVEVVRMDEPRSPLEQILNELYRRDIQSVMVEGGAEILNLFITEGLWDEARIFRGNEDFGSGLEAPSINGTMFELNEFRSSKLHVYYREKSWL